MGGNADSLLDEDVFLSAHLSLYRKPPEPVFSELEAEKKVFQMFCGKPERYEGDESGSKELNVSFRKIADYVSDLSNAAPYWYQIHNSQSPLLKKILLLNGGKELKVFLLAMLVRSDIENLSAMFVTLEKVLFRNRTMWFFDERTTVMWGRELYQKQITLEDITQRLNQLIEMPVSSGALIQSMNYLFTYVRGPIGFHRWVGLKYFLFCYEERLKQKFKESNDKVSIDDYDDTTIEHVIPQQWQENWHEVVNRFTLGLESDKQGAACKILINSLDNLTILKNGKNASLGKLGWIDKQKRYQTGSYNEINISQKERWTEKEIRDRGRELLLFLEERVQGLRIPDEEKAKMLFYEDYVIQKVGG